MNTSNYFTQQLQSTVRQALRQVAADDAKSAGSNRTRKVPPVNLRRDRYAKTYRMET